MAMLMTRTPGPFLRQRFQASFEDVRMKRVVNMGQRFGVKRFLSGRPIDEIPNRLTVLCILDGWGYNKNIDYNAVLQARTPNFDRLWGEAAQRGSQAFMHASENWVGLPTGQIGNSEVGHMTLGSGRRILHDLLAIDEAIASDVLKDKEALKTHIAALKKTGGTSHILGLISPGGVHSMQSHVSALANEVNKHGVKVMVHVFTDGRDVPPQDAAQTLPQFVQSLDSGVKIATVTGRYFAMDRDNRWERVGQAYDAIMNAKGVAPAVTDPLDAVKQAYEKGETDEFIKATVVADYNGVQEGDGVLMANFRADRAREIMTALASPNPPAELGIGGGSRPVRPKLADVTGIVRYSEEHKNFMSEIFPVKEIHNTIGEVVSSHGLRQLRIAETEKYPHVSFFFNGGREEVYENEDRILVASPKVATYDLQPEMSAPKVGAKVCEAVDSGKYDMIILNFANPDMVGHTGSLSAAIAACEAVDSCLGDLAAAVERQKGFLLTTADHGNCEYMWDFKGNCPHTAHTLNLVPLILSDFSGQNMIRKLRSGGSLADVAPTILTLLGLSQPSEMTGTSLIET